MNKKESRNKVMNQVRNQIHDQIHKKVWNYAWSHTQYQVWLMIVDPIGIMSYDSISRKFRNEQKAN